MCATTRTGKRSEEVKELKAGTKAGKDEEKGVGDRGQKRDSPAILFKAIPDNSNPGERPGPPSKVLS